MPESTAPKLGKVSNRVIMDVKVSERANAVLYALAGFSGGLTCYLRDNHLHYEFNLFTIRRPKIRAKQPVTPGKHSVEVESRLVDRIGGPIDVTLRVDGREVASGRVPNGMSLHSTSNEPLISVPTAIHLCRSITTTRHLSASTVPSDERISITWRKIEQLASWFPVASLACAERELGECSL
jgi:hypothetical protein